MGSAASWAFWLGGQESLFCSSQFELGLLSVATEAVMTSTDICRSAPVPLGMFFSVSGMPCIFSACQSRLVLPRAYRLLCCGPPCSSQAALTIDLLSHTGLEEYTLHP